MKNLCLIISLLLFTFSYSQKGVPFKENEKLYLQGNSILIGNNILGDHPTKPLMNIDISNDEVEMKYIDVDDDPTTFSSSEASITNLPENAKIAHATLYWSGLYPYEKSTLRKFRNEMRHVGVGERDASVNSIMFKTPNGNYEHLDGKVIFDSNNSKVFKANSPYVCYADVTENLQDLITRNGAYTVANIKATEGKILGGGSAGWLLYVIYEDIEESPKYFTTYNGLLEVNNEAVKIDFKDFKSKEDGEYKTTVALATLEGDRNIKTDKVSIFDKKKGRFMPLSSKNRDKKNFFNSSITSGDEFFTARSPNSANTLGFDLLKMEIQNPNNKLLDNSTTQVKLQFETKKDRFYLFFVAFETEINKDFLEEKIKVAKDNIVSLSPSAEILSEEKLIETISKPEVKTVAIVEKSKENLNSNKSIELSEEEEIIRELDIETMLVSGLESGYYLITNVFSVSGNASKWSEFLTEKKYTAKTFINPSNNWNYVYISNNKDLKTLHEKWKQYNELEYFKKIWIVKINL